MENFEDWQYPLSATLGEIESQQVNTQMPLRPPRTQPSFNPTQESQDIQNHGLNNAAPRVKKGGVKRVTQRGKAFSKEEDKMIYSAFLNVSKDAVTGTNQSSGGYYQRLHDYFNVHLGMPSTRSVVAIQHRWLTIQKAVNKFCGFLSVIERRNESGKTKQNRIDDAMKMYEQSEPFGFIHCWTILKDEPKWTDRMPEINNVGTTTRVNQKMAGNNGVDLVESQNADNGEQGRPEGRDNVKKRRCGGGADTSSSSTAFEVLQHIQERGKMKDEKEDTQMAQILQRKDAKIELQQNMLSMQRENMQKRWEIEVEKLNLSREEVQMRKDQTQIEMMRIEAHFNGQDLDKLAPHLKEYYLSVQRQILERRGIRPPPEGSS